MAKLSHFPASSKPAIDRKIVPLMQGYNFIVLSTMTNADSIPVPGEAPLTPLSAAVHSQAKNLRIFCGVRTPGSFDEMSREIDALFSSAGIFDLGWRGKILVTGSDRLRWLNGMVTNTVQGLLEDEGNYSFLLNTQGRIQGDCYVYRRANDLILDTSRDQLPALMRHLDHYIIMDEVELIEVSESWTGLELVGPQAHRILQTLGLALSPAALPSQNVQMSTARIGEIEITLIEAHQLLLPRYEIWFHPAKVLPIWEALKGAGASSVGLEAMETLRVAEARPLYGVDLNDRDLPQETNQPRALNFTKGCYLGQEIVERIRSRGKVHRQLRQFALEGAVPPPPFELQNAEQVVGRVTSAASISSVYLTGSFGLGFAREESLARKSGIEYKEGTAIPLEGLPHISNA
ncbi:MAG TPA: folate-binding protein [Acidobacteriaceae bacterium]